MLRPDGTPRKGLRPGVARINRDWEPPIWVAQRADQPHPQGFHGHSTGRWQRYIPPSGRCAMNVSAWKSDGGADQSRSASPTDPPTNRRQRRKKRSKQSMSFRTVAAATTMMMPIAMGLPVVAANAVQAPVGEGFTITPSDLSYILKQIKIAERHAATLSPEHPCDTLIGTGPDQIPSPLVSQGCGLSTGHATTCSRARRRSAQPTRNSRASRRLRSRAPRTHRPSAARPPRRTPRSRGRSWTPSPA
jgi:hypothetical protein